MNFEYNGNLYEDDRIALVAKEITACYPQISTVKARAAAMLEGRISAPKTVEDECNRLYNLMLVNCENKEIVVILYKDFLEVLKKSKELEAEPYFILVEAINSYLQDEIEFPLLSDYQ